MPYVLQVGTNASQERLEKLLVERLKPGAEREKIDTRLWNLFGETWAVMFTDLSGFSRNVAEFGIIHFLQVIYESQRLFVPCVDRHDGILLKMEGDSMLVIFRTPSNALACAVDMQRVVKSYNADKQRTDQVLLCVGIGYGKMLRIGDQDVFGAEVNAASKLGEDTAKAWDILVTDSVAAAVDDWRFEPIDDVPPGAKSAAKLIYSME